MESEEIRELRANLLKLKQEHRDLDSAIDALEEIRPRRSAATEAAEEEKAVPERRDRPHRGPAAARYHRLGFSPCPLAPGEAPKRLALPSPAQPFNPRFPRDLGASR